MRPLNPPGESRVLYLSRLSFFGLLLFWITILFMFFCIHCIIILFIFFIDLSRLLFCCLFSSRAWAETAQRDQFYRAWRLLCRVSWAVRLTEPHIHIRSKTSLSTWLCAERWSALIAVGKWASLEYRTILCIEKL